MPKRKTRWADGDTRAEPFVYVTRSELAKLGLPQPVNPACEGDFIDADIITEKRELYDACQVYLSPDELNLLMGVEPWPPYRIIALFVVLYHVAAILWIQNH